MTYKEKRNLKQRLIRAKTNNKSTKKYEKTKKGFLMRCYRNMLSRVKGVTKNKNHLYLGLEILDKNVFRDWSLHDESFNKLFTIWENSDYDRKKTPSIDRIDSNKGYTLDNIKWVTFSENCRRGAITKKKDYKKI